ncbi:MAG: aminoacyl-tRNA hydrolase [Pseudomonadota bacterium]
MPSTQILVVHDELDLPPGTARLKTKGGPGGNNGLRDIIQQLGTQEFVRLRLGVGHPGDRNLVTNYLTQRTPPQEERAAIESAMDNTLAVMPNILSGDFNRAMNQLH